MAAVERILPWGKSLAYRRLGRWPLRACSRLDLPALDEPALGTPDPGLEAEEPWLRVLSCGPPPPA